MKKLMFRLVISVLFLYGCGSTKNTTAEYNYEIECMGTGMDGTQLLKVWGYGRKSDLAIEQAKKNAVHAVIFKGIATGKPGCMHKPLSTLAINNPKQTDYFNQFFSKGGRYLNFVNISNDGTINPNDRLKVAKQYKIGVVVSVSHTALRKELELKGIIKKLDAGF